MVRESILHVRRLGARPRLAYYSPIPGTADWKKMVEEGYIKEKADPLLHNKLAFLYLWGDMSPQDLAEFKNLANY